MRRATVNDRPLVVDILKKSFNDNKSVNDVVKQDRKRKHRIRRLMEYSFDLCNAFGEVWMSEDLQACALILFEDKKRTSLRTILWDLKLAFSVIGLNRVSAVLKRESMIKNHHPKNPFAYLWFIGVSPSNQNKGIGSSFIQEVIQECDRKNRPIYLETSTKKNIPFYQKFGFEIFQSLNLNYTLYQLRKVKA
ncbi:GNAT family N-acetyltransferase [Chryseolinea sp. H1M3-3]|uniref:GNAT family N-acetyltransferase n=1 Tax=Chryseolinea sp. H1M3-3 TaxID=3034144 RepID=UPI0023ED8466|nr:GNAT family N-acetyltransferase [Chryseolinea sp. H1M3-3]